MNVAVVGAGNWGRVAAVLLEANGHSVFLLHHDHKSWPAKLDRLCLALPLQKMRETLTGFNPPEVPVLSLSKGLEISTGKRASQIIHDVWPGHSVAALSGPTFAEEVAKGLPAACVCQNLFRLESCRWWHPSGCSQLRPASVHLG